MKIEINEKAKSKAQQRFFGIVNAYKKGELKDKDVSQNVIDAAKNMTKKDIKDFAKTKHKDLPNHINHSKTDKINENKLNKIVYECINKIKENNNKLNNNKQDTSIAKGGNYSHFAVNKLTNKIVNGWDYNGYDSEELRQFKKDYFINDLIDYDLNPKDYNILTIKGCLKKGIDPFDDSQWSIF